MKRHAAMTSADLITLIKRLDPTGNAPVVEFRKGRGYNALLGLISISLNDLVPSVKPNQEGDYLALDDYEMAYPRGHQKSVEAIVIGTP